MNSIKSNKAPDVYSDVVFLNKHAGLRNKNKLLKLKNRIKNKGNRILLNKSKRKYV